MKAGEFDLIEMIRRRAGSGSEQRLGIGDDCSSVEVPSGHELLTSTDLLLEDVHFRLDWTDLHSLGEKSVAVNISDVAAMGGRSVCLHLGLGIPSVFSDEQIAQYLEGIYSALVQYEVFLAGGDTCRSNGPLMISVTVQGLCLSGQAVTRRGAKVEDDIWVSGTLGDSGLALRYLQQKQPLPEFLADRHFRPRARAVLGQLLGERKLASAMIDLSDGLAGDLHHLLQASQVGAQISMAQLPLSEIFSESVKIESGLMDLALCGGEDYELLFTSATVNRASLESLSRELDIPLSRVGKIVSSQDLVFNDVDGQIYSLKKKSFDHFASTGDLNCD